MPKKFLSYHLIFAIPILLSFTSLLSCASNSSPRNSNKYQPPQSSSSSNIKSRRPKVPVRVIPGGRGDNWRYLGTSQDGQLIAEINESSINLFNLTNKTYSFQDRKTINNPATFDYINQIPYKYVISIWQISCLNRQYLFKSSETFNALGTTIRSYKNDNPLVWNNIMTGTISQYQYDYICLGVNRNLGY